MSDGTWQNATIRSHLSAEFPGEWGDEPQSYFSNARILRSTNLDDDGHIDYDTAAHRDVLPAKLEAKQLRRGDILLEASGGGPGKPVGRVAMFDPPDDHCYIGSNFFRTLRPSAEVHPQFLAWRLLLVYVDPGIWAFQQQTTGIINLKSSEYLDQVIAWPPLPEQRRIAEILDTVDEAIQRSEQLIAKLKQIKAGLLHDLLTRGLDERGQLRDPVAHPEQFKDSPLGRIPREWEIVSIEQLGKVESGGTPSRQVRSFWNGPVNWVTPSELTQLDGRFLYSTRESITEAGLANSAAKLLPPGSILVTTRATIGAIAIAGTPVSTNQGFKSIVPNENADSDFYYYLLQLLVPEMARLASGSTFVEISRRDFAAIRVPRPPLPEQRRIAVILDAHDARLRAEEAYRDKLQQLKQGLMHDLLAGKVRVKA